MKLNLQFFGGRGGAATRNSDKMYNSKQEAVNAAYEHPAIARGDEVFVLGKGGKWVVTEDRKKYKGWRNVVL